MSFRDIEIVGPRRVSMYKKLWAEQELALAKCLNLEIDIDESTVYADLETTTQVALLEFIKESFRSFAHNPENKIFRERVYEDLSKRYEEMHEEFYRDVLSKAGYHDALFWHQKDALASMAYKKFNLLSFQMGLGKTITSATISKIFKIKRTVVICPQIVKWNWYRDLTDKKWGYNELFFTILDATQSKCIKAFQERFVIVNYEMIGKFLTELNREPIGHIIIDECTMIKNHNSNRYKSIAKLVASNPDVRVTFLSGTPVKNRINDMFAYLKLSSHPLGENYTGFLRDFTQATSGRGGSVKISGGRNLDKLFAMMSNFMIRRTKEECLDLPPKTIYKYRFELDDYREEYNKIIAELVKQKDIAGLHSSLHSLNIIVAKSKIKGIIEMANTVLDEGRKVIIFSGYKEPLNMLVEHFGKSCVKIDGSIPSHMRDTYIQKFLHDDNVTVFLGNMQAAGVGINLVNSSDVIFTNFPFVPADLWQSEDRAHRIGQVNNVNIYYTICEDSIDEHLYDIICDKATDINALVDRGKETVDYTNIPEMLYKRLVEKYIVTHGQEEEKREDSHIDLKEGNDGVYAADLAKQEVPDKARSADPCDPPW